ncbi:FecR family protein [Mucilaginibacter flavus]|uniref:FecR family protein n=1 Tax=Mucilaginibacter flavus TaxID=931504 RepID=UPI0025B3FA5C|nr:FecR family protein [Mucilaginibacter flavus]MDN3582471.1 FecR domain-containing protein [Mucilaginibacter flavus]
MNRQTIYNLIRKYRDNTATEQEKETLTEWYRNVANQNAEFPDDEETVEEEMLFRINNQINPLKRRRHSIRNWSVAASVIFVLSFGTYFFTRKTADSKKNELVHNTVIVPGSNKAILTLANGQKISLTDAQKGTVINQSGVQISKTVDGQLVYTAARDDKNAANATAAVQYNSMETPRGGQYQLLLPDGTRVWLNASSLIKYPVDFNTGSERKVELSGEAYFEVAHNKSRPFRVVTSRQVVEVLGTHFNVNAYKDEPNTKTTLLEGSVKVTGDKESAMLKPGQQANLTDGIKVSDVDAEEAVAWKNGYFRFDDEKLETVMRKVSRWYNVDVEYRDNEVKNYLFAALTTRFDNLSTLLKIMDQTVDANFSVEGTKIIISKKVKK